MEEKPCILVVEDNEHLLKATVRVLRRVECEVTEAATGQDALRLAREAAPDLVLLDVNLPDIDGLEVCQRIKTDGDLADSYVMMLSASKSASEDQVLGLEAGADGYVTRPVSNSELVARVQALLRVQRAEKALRRTNAALTEANALLQQQIADRRRAEAALRESEIRYRTLFNGGNDAIFVHHFDDAGHPTAFVEVNDVACRRLGYTREELLALSPAQIDAPEVLSRIPATAEKILRQGHVLFETRHVARDGTEIPVEINSHLVELSGRRAVVSIARDIRARKRVEAALQESEARFRRTFDQSPLGSALVSLERRFLRVNAALCQLLGYTSEDFRSLALEDIVYPDRRQDDVRLLRRLELGQIDQYDVDQRYRCKDGSAIWVHVSLRVVRDANDAPLYFLLMVQDINTRKRMENLLRDYADNLERKVADKVHELEMERAKVIQAGKMASLGEMATGVAHELNQPLTAISFDADYLKILVQRIPTEQVAACPLDLEELYKIGQDLSADVDRCRRIIDHLREFGRASEGYAAEIDVNATLADSFILVGARLKDHGVEVAMDLTPDLPPILADEHKLEQVFLNLISNAEYAMQARAEALDEVDEAALEAAPYRKKLEIVTCIEGDRVVVKIADNGIGIPESAREQLFQPFFTTKPVGEGTGLGLSISYGIVTEYGGEIAFESTEGEGTTFVLRFPEAGREAV